MSTVAEVTPIEAFHATLHPIFRECVEPESIRYAFQFPFVQAGKVYATDGRIAARCDATEGRIAAEVKAEGRVPSMAGLFPEMTGYLAESISVPTTPELATCRECNGTMVQVEFECGPCKGAGFVECNLGHDHDCESCNGVGKIPPGQPCEYCDQTGKEGSREASVNLGFGVLLGWKFAEILHRHGAYLRLPRSLANTSPVYWYIPETDVDGMVMSLRTDP